jgi:hypothetical protein
MKLRPALVTQYFLSLPRLFEHLAGAAKLLAHASVRAPG